MAGERAIEEEVMGLLDRLGVKDQVHSVTVPYIRSSSARIMLHITEDLGLALARKKQIDIVTALKAMAPVSKIPGSDGAKLWTTPHWSPAERVKIRAIVSVKSYLDDQLAKANPHKFSIEIDWRGS